MPTIISSFGIAGFSVIPQEEGGPEAYVPPEEGGAEASSPPQTKTRAQDRIFRYLISFSMFCASI